MLGEPEGWHCLIEDRGESVVNKAQSAIHIVLKRAKKQLSSSTFL